MCSCPVKPLLVRAGMIGSSGSLARQSPLSCKTEWAVVLALVSYQVHSALTLVHQDIQRICLR
jgi:hypothetical protein